MNFDVFHLLSLGIGAVFIAMSALSGMVFLELGPATKLQGHRKLVLTLMLGSGVLTFSAKLLLIVGLTGESGLNGSPSAPTLSSGLVDKWTSPSENYVITDLSAGQTVPNNTPIPSPGLSKAYQWEALPLIAPSPDDNPTTTAKVALGKRLFEDPLLSKDQSVSCASCHGLYDQAGGDGLATARGIADQHGPRNTPTIWNSAFQALLFWDGRARSLEEQALGPLLNPVEMGMPSLDAVEERVKAQAHYQTAFAQVFGPDKPINITRIAQAIAAYERTLITPDSAYDRFVRGDTQAISAQQIRGMALFESLGCITCHYGPNFSAASSFDDTAPRRIFPSHPSHYEKSYPLLETAPSNGRPYRAAWRVPSLRNVALTGPWLHNGAVDDLEEVVRIMAASQLGLSGQHLLWSPNSRTLSKVNRAELSQKQVDDLVAFLHALSSEQLLKAQQTGSAEDTRPARY